MTGVDDAGAMVELVALPDCWSRSGLCNITSVALPFHFDTAPDPRIRFVETQIRIIETDPEV